MNQELESLAQSLQESETAALHTAFRNAESADPETRRLALDHLEAAGLVVTLQSDTPDRCWGLTAAGRRFVGIERAGDAADNDNDGEGA